MDKSDKLDERRVTPWYMALAFAEVMMYAAYNDDEEPRKANKDIIYYERCTLNKISGVSAAQRRAGVIPEFTGNVDEETLAADKRTFVDTIINPFDRETLQSILTIPHSLEKIKRRLQDFFDRSDKENLKLIFKNWKEFLYIESLIIGETSIVKREDIENAHKFAGLDASLHAIIRSYALNFLPFLTVVIDFAQGKSMLFLGRYSGVNFEDIRKTDSIRTPAEVRILELLKDIELLKNVNAVIGAFLWLIFKGGVLTDADKSNQYHLILERTGMITASGALNEKLGDGIRQFSAVLAPPNLDPLKKIFALTDTINRGYQSNLIENISQAIYQLDHLRELEHKMREDPSSSSSSSSSTVNAAAVEVDMLQWDKHDHGTFMLNGAHFTREAQKLINLLYTYFNTVGANVLQNGILPFYKTILTDLNQRATTSIIDVYVDLVEDKNNSIATYGMRKYIRGLLRPITYMESILKNISVSGFGVIDSVRQAVETMFSTVPRFPQKLAWDEITVVPPHETGVYPWLVPSLVRYDGRVSVEGVLYDALPCRRGAIISLLSALESDPKHHRLTKDHSRRVIDAYSLVLFINLRHRSGDAVYSPHADTGSTYAVTIHAKKTEIHPVSSVPIEKYKERAGSRYAVFDSKRFATHEFRTVFDVERFIFDTLLPPLVHERKPLEVVRTPLIVFRVFRSKDDINDTESYLEPSKSFVLPDAAYSTFRFVAQHETRGHANACTSYATIMAFFMFNKLGDMLLSNDETVTKQRRIENQKTLFRRLVDPFYTEACKGARVARGQMTFFVGVPKIPTGIDTGFDVTTIRQVFGDIRRCFRVYNPNHPALARLRGRNSNEELEMKRMFADMLVNKFEVARGLVMQEIALIMTSPLNLRYDPIQRTYTSRPFAIGLTLSGHSRLIFVDTSIYKFDQPSPREAWIKPRSYFLYDSASGQLAHFDTLIQLEEYILSILPYKVFQQFTSVEMLTSEDRSENFYDMNVYFSEADTIDMYNIISDQYKDMGLYLESGAGQPRLNPTISVESFGVSAIGHSIDATFPLMEIDQARAVLPLLINRSSIPLIKAASGESASATRSTPMAPTRILKISSSVSGEQSEEYDEITLAPTREQLEAARKQKETLAAELREAKQQENNAEKERIALEKQRAKKRKEEEKERIELESLSSSVIEEQQKLETTQKNIEKKEEEIAQQARVLKETEERKNATELERQRKQAELTKQREETARLKREQEEKEKESKRLEEERKRQEQERKAIEIDTKRIEKEVEAQKKNVEAVLDKIKKLNFRIVENEQGTINLQTQIEELNTKRATLQGQQTELAQHDLELARMDEQLLQRLSEHTQLGLALEEEKGNLEAQNRELQAAQREQAARQKKEESRQRQLQRELARQERLTNTLERRTQQLRRSMDDDIVMEDAPTGEQEQLMDDEDLPDVSEGVQYLDLDSDSEKMDTNDY